MAFNLTTNYIPLPLLYLSERGVIIFIDALVGGGIGEDLEEHGTVALYI